MGQVLLKDKIGLLSESAGTITLEASRLTIGGQQYETPSLNVSANVSIVNTRYQVYAVRSAGNTILVVDANENSGGPVGFDAHKLVGSYYTNGLASIGFGSFVNIQGVPTTNKIDYLPTGDWDTAVTYTGFWSRTGDELEADSDVLVTGTPGPGAQIFDLPVNFLVDFNKITSSAAAGILGMGSIHDFGSTQYQLQMNIASTTQVRAFPSTAPGTFVQIVSVINSTTPITFVNNDRLFVRYSLPVQDWDNTPIEDL